MFFEKAFDIINGQYYLNERQKRDKNILAKRSGFEARYAQVIGKNRSYLTWLHGKDPIRYTARVFADLFTAA